jgi:tRNA 5-methylaminomethyl-2-thiouridine biosynthesis bifunctional protein
MRFTKIANQIANEKWKSAQIFKGAFEPRSDFDEERINQINELIIEMGYGENVISTLTKEEALQKINLERPGIWFQTAAIYSLPKICQNETKYLSEHDILCNTTVRQIKNFENLWHIYDGNNQLLAKSKSIVLSGGIKTKELLKYANIDLTLRPVRGQLTQFLIKQDSDLSKKLPKTVLRGDGYCLPAFKMNDQNWIWEVGSTYDEDQDDLQTRSESDFENAIKGLTLIGCEHLQTNDLKTNKTFIGVRSASKDRLPLIGPIIGHTGLFIACAYGSRGVLWSALGSELISAYVEAFLAGEVRLRAGFLTGASEELSEEVATSVSPSRFLATRASNSKPIFPVS